VSQNIETTAAGEQTPHESALSRALKLEWIPRTLASIASRYLFVALFLYLVVLPVTGIYTPSSNSMLIGGNYTNVTGALGACIASAVGLAIHRDLRKRHFEQRLHEALVREKLGIHLPGGDHDVPRL
jgi:uncharacterized membrane protein